MNNDKTLATLTTLFRALDDAISELPYQTQAEADLVDAVVDAKITYLNNLQACGFDLTEEADAAGLYHLVRKL